MGPGVRRDDEWSVSNATPRSRQTNLICSRACNGALGWSSPRPSSLPASGSALARLPKLMPPTLIASVYGMNFKVMPELEWVHGYPMALVMMLLAAVLPYVLFKWKKWL